MTFVNFNGNNIIITGTGNNILYPEDIRRIDFDFAEVEINGFNGISQEASWYLDHADTIQLAKEVTDINRCYFRKARVNHPSMFSNKESFKDLNDLKTSLDLQCHCNDDFVYLVYPAEHKQWDDTVVHGYHLTMCETVVTPTKVVDKNAKDFFIEVESIREPINLKTTRVKQVLKAIYPLNLKSTEVKDFASFIINNARDKIIHLDKPDKKWLTNEYDAAPTIEEQWEVDKDNRIYLSCFEQELLLDKEATLNKYGFNIFHSKDLQAICEGHIDDFKIRIYEQDSFGPVVAGFYADGKDYAF